MIQEISSPVTPWVNLNAGPAALPSTVLQQASNAILSLNNSGLSILSISHRSPEFETILNETNQNLKSLLNVPDTHAILWMQGGASTQFHLVVMNLLARKSNEINTPKADYVVTGSWSEKAAEMANHLGVQVNHVIPNPNFKQVPPRETWTPSGPGEVLFTYVCTNETVHGIEIEESDYFPLVESNQSILVADMSSNILSKQLEVSKYGIIFAGAQKNMGPAGVTLVIVRKDLISPVTSDKLPTMFDYATFLKSNSLHNTPPVYAIYVIGLMLQWIQDQGGMAGMNENNQTKATLLYSALKKSRYFHALVHPPYQSRMNVVFNLVNDDGKSAELLTKKFLKFAESRGIIGLNGHRSVGGCRASLYNAVTLEDVQRLISVIEEFDLLI
jgi:phosphoserine aminotransferase